MTPFPLSRTYLGWIKQKWREDSTGVILYVIGFSLFILPMVAMVGYLLFAVVFDLIILVPAYLLTLPGALSRSHQRRLESQQRHREQQVREQQLYERQQQEQAHETQTARNRRICEQARLDCELLYDRNAVELQNRLPRQQMVNYFESYMPLDGDPADVQERGEMLQAMIKDNLSHVSSPDQQQPTMESIAETFRRKRQELESTDLDEETRQSMIASLKMQEREAIRLAMEVNV